MHDTAAVHVRQRSGDVAADSCSLLGRERAKLNARGERRAFDELHNDENVFARLAGVVDAHEVRMRKARERLHL